MAFTGDQSFEIEGRARQHDVYQALAEKLVSASRLTVDSVDKNGFTLSFRVVNPFGPEELFFSYSLSSAECETLKDITPGTVLVPKLLHPPRGTGEDGSLESFIGFGIEKALE